MSGDLYYSNVSLLLHGDGTNLGTTFTDNSLNALTSTVNGNTNTSTAQSKFGTASIYFDGVGDYLNYSAQTVFAFGTGDFTIECWINPSVTTDAIVYDFRPYTVQGSYPTLYILGGVFAYAANTGIRCTGTTTIVAGTWYHVAISRTGTSTKLFVNGVQEGTTYTDSSSYLIGTSRPTIGVSGYDPTTNNYNGYVDDFRITKGIGRYTTTFTPSTTAFGNYLLKNIIGSGNISFLGNTTLVQSKRSTISETLTTSTSLSYKQIIKIIDTISLYLSYGSKQLSKETINDYLFVLDILLIKLRGSISESIVITDTITNIISRIGVLLDNIVTTSSFSTKVRFSPIILELIDIIDSASKITPGSITESLVLSSTISSLYRTLGSILESGTFTSTLSSSRIQILSLSDNILAGSNLSTSSLFKNIILEPFVLSIPSVKYQDTYLAYLLSPETNSISTYDNYNFSSSTKFGYKYLFSNSTGLFEYGGNTDDSALITARMETVAYDFGSSNLKQVPAVYLGYTSSGTTIMKVSVNGKNTSIYKLNKRTENLETNKINIGKGLIGRYFQFELITDAPDFSMESIEFYPIELRRKL